MGRRFVQWLQAANRPGMLLCLALTALFVGGYALGYVYERRNPDSFTVISRLELPLVDARFRYLRDEEAARKDVVVVAVTERDLRRFRGEFGRWPWPRRVFAALFQYLRRAESVSVDVGFWEPSQTELTPDQVRSMVQLLRRTRSGDTADKQAYDQLMGDLRSLAVPDDQTLAEYTRRYGPVYHAMTFRASSPGPQGERERIASVFEQHGYNVRGRSLPPRSPEVTLPVKPLVGASAGIGHINLEPDPDGPIRRFDPFQGISGTPSGVERPYLPILGLAPALPGPGDRPSIRYGSGSLSVGDRLTVPRDRRGRVLINYRGPDPYPVVPVGALLARIYPFAPPEETLEPAWFEGRHVLIGATAPGLFDLTSTPFGNRVPGVLNHAHILDMVLSEDFLRPIRPAETLLATAVLALGLGMAATYLSPWMAALVGLALGGGYLGGGIYLFRRDVLINLSWPLTAAAGTYGVVTAYSLAFEQRRRRQIREAFGQYLAPSVLAEVLENPGELRLGGERREITVMFADVAGFTSFSENRRPEEVADVINDLLTDLTECVFGHDGVLDKYIGDALVAEFGIVPGEPDRHARRACEAALDMRTRMEQRRRESDAPGRTMSVRIGLNTGTAATGNMGSEMLFDYTAIGDTVNLASRLEGANRIYGTTVLVTETTLERAGDAVEARRIDRLSVKGRDRPVIVYELLGRSGEVEPEALRRRDQFEEGLERYWQRQWDEALGTFEDLLEVTPEDPPVRLFRDRCRAYRDDPPPTDWEGVFRLEEK